MTTLTHAPRSRGHGARRSSWLLDGLEAILPAGLERRLSERRGARRAEKALWRPSPAEARAEAERLRSLLQARADADSCS